MDRHQAFDAGAAGQWSFVANAHGAGDKARNGAFEVKKAFTTRIVRFDANPDLVGRGDEIKLSGQLQADGNGYGGQQVTIAFRARGADDYRPVTKVTTGGNGWFSTRTPRPSARARGVPSSRATPTARGSVSDSDGVDVRSSRRQNSEIADFKRLALAGRQGRQYRLLRTAPYRERQVGRRAEDHHRLQGRRLAPVGAR